MKKETFARSVKSLFFLFLRPTVLLGQKQNKTVSYGFIFPMFAMLFFTFQQAIDKSAFRIDSAADAVMRCFVGFCAGAAASLLVSLFLYVVFTVAKKDVTFGSLLSVVNLSWFLPLTVTLLGLILDAIFRIKTAVVFGFGGALISIIPLYETVFSAFHNHKKENLIVPLVWMGCGILVVTVCGLALLFI